MPCDLVREHLAPEAVEAVGLFDPRTVQRFLAKFSRGAPPRLGYRDNMLCCFLLSTQLAAAHARRPQACAGPASPRTVDVVAGAPRA